MNSLRCFTLAVLLALASAALVQAQIPTTVAGAPATIDYQGKALDSAGAALAQTSPTNYEMQFRIYDAQEAGSIIWSEKQIVTVSKGLFSVRLGEGLANGTEGSVPQSALAEAFNGSARFLGVTIVITGQTPAEILPRLAFLATPFAFVANKSVTAERLILNPSATVAGSSVNLAQVSYATTSNWAATNLTLTDQHHTVYVDSTSGNITINLPGVTSRREYFILKRDPSPNVVIVNAPTGGHINDSTQPIKLKVYGDSVVLQNLNGNSWWITSDARDNTPVGTIISSAGSATPPRGYLSCDATLLSRTSAQYSDLYAVIGTAWGTSNATDFRVPDTRGLFLRGVASGNGNDPDRNSRGLVQAGGNSGDAVGSWQGDTIAGHVHSYTGTGTTGKAGRHNHGVDGKAGGGDPARFGLMPISGGEEGTPNGSDGGGRGSEQAVYAKPQPIPFQEDHDHAFTVTGSTDPTGATETRPRNVAVYYFIKY